LLVSAGILAASEPVECECLFASRCPLAPLPRFQYRATIRRSRFPPRLSRWPAARLLSHSQCGPLNVMPGGSGRCSVKTPSAAPSTVVLTASALALSVPSTVTIASGATTATFSYTAGKILTGHVTLTAAFGGIAMSAAINVMVTVAAPRISSVGTPIAGGAIAPIALSCEHLPRRQPPGGPRNPARRSHRCRID
jgi:hypothetical protein